MVYSLFIIGEYHTDEAGIALLLQAFDAGFEVSAFGLIRCYDHDGGLNAIAD